MAPTGSGERRQGEAVVLRYVTTDGRIAICWPCRVVADSKDRPFRTGICAELGPRVAGRKTRDLQLEPFDLAQNCVLL